MTTSSKLFEQLDDLLTEGKANAMARESSEFDRLTGSRGKSLILFGAGGLGRRTLRGLRSAGLEPLAFCDNKSTLWGQEIEGVPILSVPDAVSRYNDTAAFVITIWSGEATDRMADRKRQLHQLGCHTVLTWGSLYWKHPEHLLPHYAADRAHRLYDQADAVRAAARLWSDEESLKEYISQIRWRLQFDFDSLADPVRHPIYFPSDLCDLRDDEVFVDCGAFDGDTVRCFLNQSHGSFKKIFAFEPDPSNFARLEGCVAGLQKGDRIHICQAAVGREPGFVSFSASGTESASVGSGSLSVELIALDDVLAGETPSYLKMDIEGSELEAIAGARRIIEEHSPALAVCSYHTQDHVWRIPLQIHSYNPDYRFFLRPHLREVWDLVCYAIPAGRLKKPGA